jgi:hypothetical protein
MVTMQLSQERLQLVSELVVQGRRLLLAQLGLAFSTTTTTHYLCYEYYEFFLT